mgnify:FL=1
MRIPKNKPVIGYKAFTKALQCRGYQFAIGKEYHHKGPIQLCTQGFHFCSSVAKVFEFTQYGLNPQTTRVCSVLAWGNVQEDLRSGRYVASNIRIIRELSLQQILSAANLGGSNYGRCNSGAFNYGSYNTGRENIGDGNIGTGNYGRDNYGSFNWGSCNYGNHNLGNHNTGCYNSANHCAGTLCTVSHLPSTYMFNKPLTVDDDFRRKRYGFPAFFAYVKPVIAVYPKDVAKYKEYIKIDCYTEAFDDLILLRAMSWKALWRFALAKAKTERTWKEQLKHLVNLPNFSYEVFKSITGLSKQQILE